VIKHGIFRNNKKSNNSYFKQLSKNDKRANILPS